MNKNIHVKNKFMKIPEIIKLARKRDDLSQVEFARKLGKTQALISKYEKGDVMPPGDVLQKCQDMIGMHKSSERTEDISAEELGKTVINNLNSKKAAKLRKALYVLLCATKGN